MTVTSFLAVGMVLVIVTGNIDLSVGKLAGFVSVVVAYFQANCLVHKSSPTSRAPGRNPIGPDRPGRRHCCSACPGLHHRLPAGAGLHRHPGRHVHPNGPDPAA